MTKVFTVEIKVKDTAKSWAIFDWCNDQGWQMEKDYNYATPVYAYTDWDYQFKFRRSEDATHFALRWA